MQRIASQITLLFLSLIPSIALAENSAPDDYIASNGELLLVQGKWVNLFGSQHETQTGSQHSSVAVRLAKPGGS